VPARFLKPQWHKPAAHRVADEGLAHLDSVQVRRVCDHSGHRGRRPPAAGASAATAAAAPAAAMAAALGRAGGGIGQDGRRARPAAAHAALPGAPDQAVARPVLRDGHADRARHTPLPQRPQQS